MGLAAQLEGKRVYFDANIFIYLVEGFTAYAQEIVDIRTALRSGACEAITSELTLFEVLVAPFKASDTKRLAVYRALIENSGAFELEPTTRSVYIRAGLYRATIGLKTADAIHVASAVEARCTAFLTNDASLRTPGDMQRILFSQAH